MKTTTALAIVAVGTAITAVYFGMKLHKTQQAIATLDQANQTKVADFMKK